MTIDLLKLAQKSNETYKDVECTFGILRVYHVPDVVVFNITLDYPRPEMPTVAMKRGGGGVQHRPIKEGDKGYDEWLLKVETYETDLFDYKKAIKYGYVFKDLEFPDTSNPPPGYATAYFNGNWPNNEHLQKKAWLDFTIFSVASDSDLIFGAMLEMNGLREPTADGVDEVKKNSE